MQHPYETDEEGLEVSMTPLIDCVFLLLVFFLVSTMTKKEERKIDVDLAKSKFAQERILRDDNQVIGIKSAEFLYLNGESVSLMFLHSYLRELSMEDKSVELRFDIDDQAPTHVVVELMDLCHFNQLKNISLRTYDEHYNKK